MVSLRFPWLRHFSWLESERIFSFFPECLSFMDADKPSKWNYVSWYTAFCAYPRLLAEHLSVAELNTILTRWVQLKSRHSQLSDRYISQLYPDPWTLELSPIEISWK
jgi:hypothetical protein